MTGMSQNGAWETLDLDGGAEPRARKAEPFTVLELEFQGARAQAVEHGRNRIAVLAAFFLAAFAVLGMRVLDLTMFGETRDFVAAPAISEGPVRRAAITDRNGEVLATDVEVPSLYVDARKVIEPVATADALRTVLPDLDRDHLISMFTSERAFLWIKRKLGPRQQAAVHALGLPGLGFKHEPHRVYPKGKSAAHILGYVDVDNHGIAGIERGLDARIDGAKEPVVLSLDMRVQHAVEQELAASIKTFSAKSAAGVVMDVNTGEVLGLASLPDYDPNMPMAADGTARFNTATRGVYEMGSTFKVFTAAIALETGVTSMDGSYDARTPIKVSGHTISDYHAEKRWLTVPEIVMHSSNIGTAKMALDIGVSRHRDYLSRLGLLSRPALELPEVAEPLLPSQWHEVETMTISFGHGLAISPLQMAAAGAALGNGGYRVEPTLRVRDEAPADRTRVLRAETSRNVVDMMRMVVTDGTGGYADVAGYEVAGKTGTAEKAGAGGYSKNRLLTSFLALFPASDPQYLVLVVLDEPQGTKETYRYATAGWNAAPTAGRVIRRIAPVLGVEPVRPELQGPRILEAGLTR